LAKSGNAEHLYLAGRCWPEGRVSVALVKALRESGDSYWMAQAKALWKALS